MHGFEYRAQSGQCCGICVQVACVSSSSNSSAHLFYPGESWSDPGNPCVTHKCEKHQDGLVVVTTKKVCPPLSCPLAQAQLSKDRCCPYCISKCGPSCTVSYQHQVIRKWGCSSPGPVRLTYCKGHCGATSSMYSWEANRADHKCTCCQELRSSLRNVTLLCAHGSSRIFSYPEVKECGCVGLQCSSRGHLDHSQALEPVQSKGEQSQQAEHGGRRRGIPGPRLLP
ncbi:hypothetical protein MC885_019274 [Smutsia gigantea]|nr:hypothetical protein MC885_019274 [Smutsia gigantea]